MTKPSFLCWFVPLIDLCIFSSARTRSFICIILWMDWWVPSFFRVAKSLWAIKVYPGQRAGGIEGDMMAANELNAHAFLQVSKLIPGKAFYMYSLVPFGNCKLKYLNKNYMEKILLSFAPKRKKWLGLVPLITVKLPWQAGPNTVRSKNMYAQCELWKYKNKKKESHFQLSLFPFTFLKSSNRYLLLCMWIVVQ